MIYNNILEAVGNTPIFRLQRLPEPGSAEILVKFEGLNIGGSIKTRTALNMILDAEQRGLLHPDSVIVEPTSGNQGIGLALVAAVKGYRAVIVMPDSVSEERTKLKSYMTIAEAELLTAPTEEAFEAKYAEIAATRPSIYDQDLVISYSDDNLQRAKAQLGVKFFFPPYIAAEGK